jgi:death on curing protein
MPKNTDTLFCFRCYKTWKRRKAFFPKACPKCNSPYWNKPRKRINKGIVIKMQEMILGIHERIIEISGGEHGVRDSGGIYNSIYKLLNYQLRDNKTPTHIGTFILNEFARRHYFSDGNKRTAYATAKIFMLINKYHLKINYKKATTFIIEIAEFNSKVTFEEIKEWLDDHCEDIKEKEVDIYLNKAFVDLMLGD